MQNYNYRKFYSEYYHVIVPASYDIHHIDFNHENNAPENLVALPRDLHERLHVAKGNYDAVARDYTLDDVTLYAGFVSNHTLFMQYLSTYIQTVDECVPYMNKRYFQEVVYD